MSYPAPVVASGSVALGGANVSLATAPGYRALKIKNIVLSTTSTTAVLVKLQNNATTAVFQTYVGSTTPFDDDSEGYHFQPGDTATLVVPAGTGQLAYTVIFEYA